MVEPITSLKCQRLGFTLQDYEKTKEIRITYLQVDEQQYKHTLGTQRNSGKNTQHVAAIVWSLESPDTEVGIMGAYLVTEKEAPIVDCR